MGRLYGPTGKFYGCGRELTGEPGRGLARRGKYGPGGELGGLDGRGRELYRPASGLGGPARGGELRRLDGRGRELCGLTGRLGGFRVRMRLGTVRERLGRVLRVIMRLRRTRGRKGKALRGRVRLGRAHKRARRPERAL